LTGISVDRVCIMEFEFFKEIKYGFGDWIELKI
jgi:hypothetical protein